jgi:hypothetical protein
MVGYVTWRNGLTNVVKDDLLTWPFVWEWRLECCCGTYAASVRVRDKEMPLNESSRMKSTLILTAAKSTRRDQIRAAKNYFELNTKTKHRLVGVARKAVEKK